MEGSYQGTCHCGNVRFNFKVNVERLGKCNCSLCHKRNAVMAYNAISEFSLLQGESSLSEYQFNTMAAKHYFCQRCGVYTHHKPRTQQDTIAVNTHCLVDFDPQKFDIRPIDGKNLS